MSPSNESEIRYCAECGRPSSIGELARFGDVMVCPDCKNSYAQKLREGVMPAAAAAGRLVYAGFWVRVLATILDDIILWVVNYLLQVSVLRSMISSSQVQPGMAPGEVFRSAIGALGIASLISMTISCCYETFFVARMGATPGKMALGLKVVNPDGSPVGLGRAFGRYFAKILSAIILGIGYIIAGFDSEKRGLHDMICGTRVIKRPDQTLM